MPNYVFAYRTAEVQNPSQLDSDAATPWMEFRDALGDKVVDFGNPVFTSSSLGNCGAGTHLCGYSFVTADDLESAVALAKGAPVVSAGGGVEVGEITELM
jgi:hypothetical protein